MAAISPSSSRQLRGVERSPSLPVSSSSTGSNPTQTSVPSRPASSAVVRAGFTGSSARDPEGSLSLEPLDSMSHLQRASTSVVKSRTGSVLSRGFILKTDHYPSGKHITPVLLSAWTTSASGRESRRLRPDESQSLQLVDSLGR